MRPRIIWSIMKMSSRERPLGFVFGVSLNFLVVRSQLKNPSKIIFEICHLTFNLKFGSSPELCVQSSCVRNGQVWELRRAPLLHPSRCPVHVSVSLSVPMRFLRGKGSQDA